MNVLTILLTTSQESRHQLFNFSYSSHAYVASANSLVIRRDARLVAESLVITLYCVIKLYLCMTRQCTKLYRKWPLGTCLEQALSCQNFLCDEDQDEKRKDNVENCKTETKINENIVNLSVVASHFGSHRGLKHFQSTNTLWVLPIPWQSCEIWKLQLLVTFWK